MKNYLLSQNYNLFPDLFDNVFFNSDPSSVMLTNVKKNEQGYQLEVQVPGFSKENLSIDFNKGYLTVKAQKVISEEERKDYVRFESATKLERSFYVGEVDEEKVTAKYQDGVLSINLPLKEKQDLKIAIE